MIRRVGICADPWLEGREYMLTYTGALVHWYTVPKREIFDRSDFPDFYTIKPLRVGDFGVKIEKIFKKFRGSYRGAKFLTRMLSLFLRRFFF